MDGVSLARNGRSVSAPDTDLMRLLGTAHTNGLRAELGAAVDTRALMTYDPVVQRRAT